MATRERVAWIFHEKARRLHAKASNGKAGLHVVLGRGVLRERDRKGRRPCIMRSSCQASREGEVASAKIDSPERQCRQRHGKARPPIPRSFLRGVIFRGGPARNRVVFINSGRGRREKGALPGSCGVAELALCLRVARGHQVREPGGSWRALQGPHVDENLPISGRSPQFFCHESSRGCLLGRTHVSSRTAPRGRKRGRLGCAPKLGQAVDRAIEASCQDRGLPRKRRG